jgi:hypothetical protein
MNEPTDGITTWLKNFSGLDDTWPQHPPRQSHQYKEMPFKKILKTVSCFRHLYYPVVNNREILANKLKI